MPPFLFLFSVSKVGLRLMGDTAGTKLRETIETRGLSLFYTIKFSSTNFICQMFFDRVNYDFLTNLSKIPHLHNQNTFDT